MQLVMVHDLSTPSFGTAPATLYAEALDQCAWADEVGCRNWAEFFLKYILSHPAVTCAIPATTSVEHMKENMGALYGALPDEKQRRRMAAYVAGL